MIKFRGLKENEIEVRVAMVGDGWAQLLLYKDARADMGILDETFGPENWTREHYECKGNLFCRVGVNVNYEHEEKEPRWVYKSDCGAESNTEKEKGEASDSFKRACVNWGIGRELYTKITIFVNTETIKNGTGWKLKNKERYAVKNIIVDKETDKILKLEIVDKNGRTVFTWADTNKAPKPIEKIEIQKECDEKTDPDLELPTEPPKVENTTEETEKKETTETTENEQPKKKTRVKREV